MHLNITSESSSLTPPTGIENVILMPSVVQCEIHDYSTVSLGLLLDNKRRGKEHGLSISGYQMPKLYARDGADGKLWFQSKINLSILTVRVCFTYFS